MQEDNIHSGLEARKRLHEGVKKVADAVRVTMGTGGSNALLQRWEHPYHIITNDGISIAESIQLADPIQQMGRNLLLESISRANKQSGDGSSTTTVVTEAIIDEGMKVSRETPPMELKRSLEQCLPIVLDAIDAQTRQITPSEVAQVAAISAEDPQVGAILQEIYEKIGKNGILHLDISKTFEDHYTLGTGVKIDGAGMASPYMSDADDSGRVTGTATYKNPKILVTRQKITSVMELDGLVASLFNDEVKELVIFCDEYEPTIIPDLVMTRMKRGFKVLLVKLPVLWKDWWFEDIAKMTGATIVDAAMGVSFKTMGKGHLGTCENLVVDRFDTYLDGIKDMGDYIAVLEHGDDEDKLRASKLNTKTARLFVGAQSDSALSYKRLKVEDARNSAYLALQHGVVPGGGLALIEAARAMPDTVGGKILAKALLAPAIQLGVNAGYPDMVIGNDYGEGRAFDTKTRAFVDMWEAGIVDSADIVKNAATNAISVASTILTAESIVTWPKQEATSPHQQPPVQI